MRSQRQLRVGEEIRHALADVLMRGDLPWPAGFDLPSITVAEVQVSPDLKNATVFVMPLGGVKLEETVRTLNNHVGFFRHMVAQKINLRYMPKLVFSPDRSFDYAKRISEILHDPKVAKDLDDDDDDKE